MFRKKRRKHSVCNKRQLFSFAVGLRPDMDAILLGVSGILSSCRRAGCRPEGSSHRGRIRSSGCGSEANDLERLVSRVI